jgi:hypothetical protein
MAASHRPGWSWNPWRGVLQQEELGLVVNSRLVEEQGVAEDAELQLLLHEAEQEARHRLRSA